MKTYTLTICGLTRKLPLVHISKKTLLANFTFLGDIELVDCLADTLAGKLKKSRVEYLVCPHVKVVPLVHGVAKRLGHKRFIVCRKSVKPYMNSPVILKPLPHFPKHVQPMVINGSDAELLKRKKVVIIDDVVSTGITMRMTQKLMGTIGATVLKCIAVIRQGDTPLGNIENLTYLHHLPIFSIDSI
ncbi:adenine phosphoribosyltransferase [Candidatus Gottesmanbacteria bacterium]|nr:adenine phosphoribosyltransferase [Candidatus Gottesmanbacteria bacterium]